MKVISLVEKSGTWSDESQILLCHFSKNGSNPFLSASVNGDDVDYIYPIDAKKFVPTAKTADERLATAKEMLEHKELDYLQNVNFYDIPVSDVAEGFSAMQVTDNDNLQPITIFHRASFEPLSSVTDRLRAQVRRQIANGDLKPLTAEDYAKYYEK